MKKQKKHEIFANLFLKVSKKCAKNDTSFSFGVGVRLDVFCPLKALAHKVPHFWKIMYYKEEKSLIDNKKHQVYFEKLIIAFS